MTGLLQLVTDQYSRKARFLPAVLVVAPVCVLAGLAIPVATQIGTKVAALAAACLPFLVSQIVRDRGLLIESRLFVAWGGRPSEVLLRWRDAPSRTAVERRHRLVETHFGIALPDAAAEAADPAEADAVYAIATAALRERTRDRDRFPLVFAELVAYGFRRNGYACRLPAIAVCMLTAAGTVVLARWSVVPLGWKQQTGLIFFDALWAAVWWLGFTPVAVQRVAQKYANQLFVSLENLNTGPVSNSQPTEP
ncbi:hypothetical protein GCM10010435_89270 [Winogradskya consettensis]|uniref:Uncharacterized protein n=1 Tax=Winogradskya consettensis TaxID=113560 RepID=A0A919SSF8_9ACTN|nr:hypothetical protein [Actinoplanes consettensis]GIM77099.1 hypothetical protein Aco04nite_53730 [Actinoplanes consettensis]